MSLEGDDDDTSTPSSSRASRSSSKLSSRSSTQSDGNKRELCVFFMKVGSCRHGEKCSRAHVSPKRSKTVLLQNFYPEYEEPNKDSTVLLKANTDVPTIPDAVESGEKRHFEEFYTETFTEIYRRYGQIRRLYVCENAGDHMRGNVYVRFRSEKAAQNAVNGLNMRWFAGRPIRAKLSPVADFHGSAICRQFQSGICERGLFCNFLHLRKIPPSLEKKVKRRSRYSDYVAKSTGRRDCKTSTTNQSMQTNSSCSLSTFDFVCSISPTCISADSDHTSDTTSTNYINDRIALKNLPKAFRDTIDDQRRRRRQKRSNPASDTEISEHEAEIIQKAQQIIRLQRWQLFKRKLLYENILMDEEWTEAKEQNFIFNLL